MGIATFASAQKLYEENFAGASGGANDLPSVGWSATGDFSISGYGGTFTYTLTNSVTLQPMSGQTAVYMGSGAMVNEGFFTTDESNLLSGFNDIPFTGSLTFGSFVQVASGNGSSANETARFLVQDGGNWYASANPISGPTHTGSLMDPRTMILSPTATNWITVSGIGTSNISFGTTAGSNLGSTITGSGIVFTLNNVNYYTFNYGDFTISTVPEPALSSMNITWSGDHVVLSWPSSATNLVLQQNSDLTTTNWLTTNLAFSDDGTNKTISLIPTNGSLFFRLSGQSSQASQTNGLKGIAAYYQADITNAALVGATWAYDWQADFPNLPASVEYVPMVWTYSNQTLATMTNLVTNYQGYGSKEVLSFNEPDNSGQANLTVAQALQGYGYLYQGPLPVISPACGDDADSWMQSFMSGAASAGYIIPVVAVHQYSTNATAFLNYIDKIHILYGKPLWITEFADTDEPYINWATTNLTTVGVDNCVAFINAVLPGLQSRSYVVRYSWYCPATGSSCPSSQGLGTAALWNSDKTITEVGAAYKNPGTAFTAAGYTWRLVNRATVKCLDNLGQTTNGSGVFQYPQVYSANQTQRWTITTSGSHYKLQCVSGGLYLDTLGETASGSLVGQAIGSSSSNQLWDITSVGAGCFKFTSVASGLCLATLGTNTNAAPVGQLPSGSSFTQNWMFIGY